MTQIVKPERAHPQYVGGGATTDEEILAAVLNALHHNSGVPGDHLRAEVRGGVAVLSGVVSEVYEITLAEQAAAGVPGVTRVHNNITLAS